MHKKLIPIILICLPLAGCQREDTFPSRPITLICPWAAGGGTDRVSRQIAFGLEQELGVPVNVINATGGGGVTGHTRGALARPDGYTLTTITPELTMLHWRGMTNITFEDFDPLMSVNGDWAALFVRADSELDVKKLAHLIRTEPGTIKASGSAFGSIWHVALAGWLTSMGRKPTDVIWVSANGSAPSLQQLLAHSVDVICCSVPEAANLLNSGRVRCIAVMADSTEAPPEGPTLERSGSNWSLGGWRGIALPRGVPEERKQVLLKALRKVVTGQEYREFLRQAGFGHRAGNPAQFTQTLRDSDRKFGDIFQSEDFRSLQQQSFGPMFYPAILAGLFVLTLIALAFVKPGSSSTLGSQGITTQAPASSTPQVPVLTPTSGLRIGVVLALLLFYVLVAEWLGFVLTASIVVLVLFWQLGVRWWLALAVTLCLVPAVYHLFVVGLRVPLPWGVLGW